MGKTWDSIELSQQVLLADYRKITWSYYIIFICCVTWCLVRRMETIRTSLYVRSISLPFSHQILVTFLHHASPLNLRRRIAVSAHIQNLLSALSNFWWGVVCSEVRVWTLQVCSWIFHILIFMEKLLNFSNLQFSHLWGGDNMSLLGSFRIDWSNNYKALSTIKRNY